MKIFKKKSPDAKSGIPWWKTLSNSGKEVSLDDAKKSSIDLCSAFRAIHGQTLNFRVQYGRNLALYEGRYASPTSVSTSIDAPGWNSPLYPMRGDSRENIYMSLVDAAMALWGAMEPRIQIMTIDGSYEEQRKAELCTLALEGIFRDANINKLIEMIKLTSLVMDTGEMKIYPDVSSNKICFERVLPFDIYTDYVDAKYGNPRSKIHTTEMSRTVLYEFARDNAEMAGLKRTAFDESVENGKFERMIAGNPGGNYQGSIEDPVTVIEGWHLKSGPNANDGAHVICTSAGPVALPTRWEKSDFPFARLQWRQRLMGDKGIGLVTSSQKLGNTLDWLTSKIHRIINLSTIRVWLQRGDDFNKNDLNNTAYPIGYYKVAPPTINPDPGPDPSLLNERSLIRQLAYQQEGLSEMQARSMKPAGLTSGEAQLQYKDTQSRRLLIPENHYDRFWIDIANRTIDAASDLGDDYMVPIKPADAPAYSRMRWTDVSLPPDKYRVEIAVASALPRNVAGRTQQISELQGMFPAVAPLFATLINDPDVDSVTKILAAPARAVRADIEAIERGEIVLPEPFIDLQIASTVVLASYLDARNHNAPENILDNYRNYLIAVSEMKKQAEAALVEKQNANQQPPQPPQIPQPPQMPTQ